MGKCKYIFLLISFCLAFTGLDFNRAEEVQYEKVIYEDMYFLHKDLGGSFSSSAEITITGNSSNTSSIASMKCRVLKTHLYSNVNHFDGLASLSRIVVKEHCRAITDMGLSRHVIFLEKILI